MNEPDSYVVIAVGYDRVRDELNCFQVFRRVRRDGKNWLERGEIWSYGQMLDALRREKPVQTAYLVDEAQRKYKLGSALMIAGRGADIYIRSGTNKDPRDNLSALPRLDCP